MSSKRFKILYVITSLRTGGAEKMVTEISKVLTSEGHLVDVLIFDGIETPLLKELKNQGVKVYKGGKGYYQMYNPCNIFKIRRLVKKNHYDIVHSHNTSAQIFLAVIGRRGKIHLVTTEHNTTNRKRNIGLFKIFDRFIYKKYDAVVSVSHKVRENLLIHLGLPDNDETRLRFPVIYNGINLYNFGKFDNTTDFSNHLNFGNHFQQNIILMIASFRKQKDHVTAIRAMLHLPQKYKLWLAGEGKTKKQCEKLVKDLYLTERVIFLGHVNEIPSLISLAKIVILASNFEGLPVAAIEAMASGKPFIGSDVDGIKEIVGNAGILFQKGDEKDLANKIEILITSEEEYNRVATNCRRRAKCFDILTTVRKHQELYTKITSPNTKISYSA